MVNQVTLDEGLQQAFDSLMNQRLVVLCGAGLSMAWPSNLPGAGALAATAKQKYDGMHGQDRPPLAPGVEEQAEFFFGRDELDTVYFQTLIDFHAFAGRPNPGHHAVADLLLVCSLRAAVTTNVDCLIEHAGQNLYGQIGAVLDGQGVAALPGGTCPLLKLHGCRTLDRPNMVWAKGQLAAQPVSDRVVRSTAWLNLSLAQRDLLVVGYSTDWDYLNEVLANTLGTVHPATIIFVDIAAMAAFQAKAPTLSALSQRATVSALYVQASGADFLDRLRRAFSRSFVRQVLHAGSASYAAHTGNQPNAAWLEPSQADNDELWRLRRDLEGRSHSEPCQERGPPPGQTTLGLTLLQLQAKGATVDGTHWVLAGRRVRVLRASGVLLHQIASAFEREEAPTVAPDVIIAVGAEGPSLPTNVARAVENPTIARGSKGAWLTRDEAVAELNL